MQLTLAGESHGPGIVGIVSGLPSDLSLSEEVISQDLQRRRNGFGRSSRQELESDAFQILSGLRHGRTLGSPLAFLIPNREWPGLSEPHDMHPWLAPSSPHPHRVPRPGHADFAGSVKFGTRDLKSIWEMASARVTVADVLVGSICRQFLNEFGIILGSYVERIGNCSLHAPPTHLESRDWDSSPLRMPDPQTEHEALELVKRAQIEGDTLGGASVCFALHLPVGLGGLTSECRLDGQIAQSLMSIPSVKAVEIGSGIYQSTLYGSQAHDAFRSDLTRVTNFAGGIEGGLTNGQPLQVRITCKPLSTLRKEQSSIHLDSREESGNWKVRADTVVVSSAGVIAEARLGWIVMKAFMENFGGISMKSVRHNWELFHETQA